MLNRNEMVEDPDSEQELGRCGVSTPAARHFRTNQRPGAAACGKGLVLS